MLTLQLVASADGVTSPARTRAATSTPASGAACPKLVQQCLDEAPQPLRDLFADLDAELSSHGGVTKEVKRHYIAYSRLKNIATVRVLSGNPTLVVNLRVEATDEDLREGFSRRVGQAVGIKNGVEVKIRSREDLAQASDLIRRSVDTG
ncbi:DUF5655 domain-containing protein [Streptomyces platensis]